MRHKPSVLIAEDEPSLRAYLALTLQDEGYVVLPARDGQAALDLALLARPDCILLDLRMPRMDGAEFARRYRERAAQPRAIILMSANQDAPRAARDLGADGFLAKPFGLDALLHELERYCQADKAQKAG